MIRWAEKESTDRCKSYFFILMGEEITGDALFIKYVILSNEALKKSL